MNSNPKLINNHQSLLKEIAHKLCGEQKQRSTKDRTSMGIVAPRESSRLIQPFGKEAYIRLTEMYANLGELDVKKVVDAVSCLIEIYHIFGLDRLTVSSEHNDKVRYRVQVMIAALNCLDYMESIQDKKAWIPYFKYKTCAFYSAYERQDIPPKPNGLYDPCPKVIFGGYIGSWVKLLKAKNPQSFESFILTINMAKMGMPRADESMIKAAERKCAIHLTTQPPVVVDYFCDTCGMSGLSAYHLANCNRVDAEMYWGNGVKIDKESMKRELRRTVQELFAGVQYTEADHYEPFFPSTSANYIRSRNRLGAVGVVSEIIHHLGLFNPESDLVTTESQSAKLRGEVARHYGDVGTAEQTRLDEEYAIGKLHVGEMIQFDNWQLKAQWAMVMEYIKEAAYNESPLVEPVGLAEALKIRVISKGPPLLYTFLSPLQKFMWKTLQKNKVFKLIGEPITEEHVQERIGIPTDHEIVINGDYKASTDNLHSWVSKCIVKEITRMIREAHVPGEGYEFDDRHYEMFRRSLIDHRFCVDDVWLPQREGQLMGSVTSFPILCIANAAMCRWALEESNFTKYRLVDKPSFRSGKIAPLLVNGDDCTLKGNRNALRRNWEKITSFGGLSTSVGKTLYSHSDKPICVLNSTTYHLIDGVWKHIKFVNMGIMLGKTRSGTGEDAVRTYSQMGGLHRQLRDSCPEELWSNVSQRFIYYNKENLSSCPDIPWDMPEYIGGAGLLRKEVYSDLDKKCATLIINRKDNDKRFKIRKEKKNSLWVVHEKVQQRLDQFNVTEGFKEARPLIICNLSSEFTEKPFYDCEDEYSRLYKYLTCETLFKHEVRDLFSLLDLLKKYKKMKNISVAIELHNKKVRILNNRVWQNARKEVCNHSLRIRQDHEIDYQKRDVFLASYQKVY